MIDDARLKHVTTSEAVENYKASSPIFDGIIREVRELARKKPDTTMSVSKVKLINRVLADLLVILKDEPSGKYLDVLDEETLPQMSDAVLLMVQFETALKAFTSRYQRYFSEYSEHRWITQEFVAKWNADHGRR